MRLYATSHGRMRRHYCDSQWEMRSPYFSIMSCCHRVAVLQESASAICAPMFRQFLKLRRERALVRPCLLGSGAVRTPNVRT